MKTINNRVVCSGCEQGFEVGQKYFLIIKAALEVQVLLSASPKEGGDVTGYPTMYISPFIESLKEKMELFHEGCD